MIGVLGGTFDPVHHGHLRLALEIHERLGLQEVRLMLAARPPHRAAPTVSPDLRLAMLQAAVAGVPGLRVDDRELRRPGPSYMVDTLQSLRDEELGTQQPLCLLLGMDAFLGLSRWHRWERLIELAHLVVVQRLQPELSMTDTMQQFLQAHRVDTVQSLRDRPAGAVWIQPIPTLMISATEIRQRLAQGANPHYLLPPAVLAMIQNHQLYQSLVD